MYIDALMNAVNADRERLYAELERARRQRGVAAEREAEDGCGSGDSSQRPTRSRPQAARIHRLAPR